MHRRRRIFELYSRTRRATLSGRLCLVACLVTIALSPSEAAADAPDESERWTQLEESVLRRVQRAATDLQQPLTLSERHRFLVPFQHLWGGAEPHREAIRSLSGSRLPAAAFALIGVARDRDSPFRREAIDAIGMTPHWSAIPVLRQSLDDPDPDVRIAAISSLTLAARSQILQRHRDTLGSRVMDMVDSDPDPRVRGVATAALPSFGGRAFARYLEATRDAPASVIDACRMVRLRAFFGQNASPANRLKIARILAAEIQKPTASYIARANALGEQLASDGLVPCTDPRSEAIRWLGLLRVRRTGRLLVQVASDDPDPAMRAAAVTALGTFGGDTAEAAIIAALDDPNLQVRTRAVSAFDDFTDERKAALSNRLAERLVKDESTLLRAHIAAAAHDLPGDWTALVSALADPSVIVRRAAENSLLERARPAEMARLVEALDAEARLSVRATRILAAWPEASATATLIGVLESGSSEAKGMAALALGLRDDESARIPLERCASSYPQGVDLACIRALQDLDRPASLPRLREIAADAAAAGVRMAATNAHDLIARSVAPMDTGPNDAARRAGGLR